ncbi:hypothetical protein ACHAXR_010490, partial [Thalassiosira sp. AJA248-18]
MDTGRQQFPQRQRKSLWRSVTFMSALLASTSQSSPGPAFAFSFSPVIGRATTTRTIQLTPKRTICNAKLNKIASSFDLDEILSKEKEFDSSDEDTLPVSTGRGRSRNPKKSNNDKKKEKMKEQLKNQKLERQRLKQSLKDQKSSGANENAVWQGTANDGIGDISVGDESGIDYENLIKSVDFLAYEVPSSLDGKRIDTAVVELLNGDNGGGDNQASNALSISRSQCGTLLSNECVFIVPPENVTEFRAHLKETSIDEEVPHNLIEKFSSPIQRKSHPLESKSIIIYPSRGSLLSTSSPSALLSNFMPPSEIVAQNIPLDILYEDDQMIVLNKRAGMVMVHPAAGNWDSTVVNALAHYLMNDSPFGAGEFFTNDAKEEVATDDADVNQDDAVTNSISTLRPGIVHRLDKGTTGVLVVAKTSSALATMSEAFAERNVKKQYLAVAIGNPGEDQWINKPIGRHPLHRQRMRVVPDPNS